MLRDITIENYRLFEKFHLEGMTQINLLVGTNNSGKSSLLEAIYLLTSYEYHMAVLDVLQKRGEFVEGGDEDYGFQISEIFRGHRLQKNHKIVIAGQEDRQISLEYSFVDHGTSWPVNIDERERPVVGVKSVGQNQPETFGYFSLEAKDYFALWYTGDAYSQDEIEGFVTPERLSLRAVNQMWDQIVLTPKEDLLMEALRILEPNLERIALTSQHTPQLSVRLKIKENQMPVPLGSMGDGMYRIFALALSLVNCENGAFFVDEIDTGLHHKALIKMWQLVIETAKRLNVQVFATTHSWDCLVALHKALTEISATELASVFRLERKDDQVKYVSYTGDKLAVAIEHDIEVR